MTDEHGRYLAFEGIEGAGKSTVASAVADRLRARGIDVVEVREPGGTVTAERIRSVLLHDDGHVAPWTEALLFAAARAQLVHEVISPALRCGSWVVSDRSVYSSLAYQGSGRRLGVDAVRALNTPGLVGIWPELVFLLAIDAGTGLDRQDDADRIGSEGIDFQAIVSDAFDTLAADEPSRFRVVDASRPVAEVVEDVWEAVTAAWPAYMTT